MDIAKIRERSIEKYLGDEIKAQGGVYIKLNPNWYIGIPDRLAVFKGRCAFVELKRPKGGRLSGAQKMWRKMLTLAGAEWHMLCTREDVDNFIKGGMK